MLDPVLLDVDPPLPWDELAELVGPAPAPAPVADVSSDEHAALPRSMAEARTMAVSRRKSRQKSGMAVLSGFWARKSYSPDPGLSTLARRMREHVFARAPDRSGHAPLVCSFSVHP